MNTTRVLSWQFVEPPAEEGATVFSIGYAQSDITEEAFLIRFKGELHAYLNRCPHAGTTLDWNPGQFFSEDGDALVCHTHLAHFDPSTGACLSGPCPHGLSRLPVRKEATVVEVPAILTQE